MMRNPLGVRMIFTASRPPHSPNLLMTLSLNPNPCDQLFLRLLISLRGYLLFPPKDHLDTLFPLHDTRCPIDIDSRANSSYLTSCITGGYQWVDPYLNFILPP